jgi:hypothetical protein
VGDPIVMTADDITAVLRVAWWATIVVDHLKGINNRAENCEVIDTRLRDLDARDRVRLPVDGELVSL